MEDQEFENSLYPFSLSPTQSLDELSPLSPISPSEIKDIVQGLPRDEKHQVSPVSPLRVPPSPQVVQEPPPEREYPFEYYAPQSLEGYELERIRDSFKRIRQAFRNPAYQTPHSPRYYLPETNGTIYLQSAVQFDKWRYQ